MGEETYYSSMAPLAHPDVPAYLHRRIGVQACDYVPSHPGLEGGPAWQVVGESVSLNTTAIGSYVPAGIVEQAIDARTEWVIAQLDAALTELWKHRERLASEHLRRTGQYPASPAAMPILKMLRDELKARDELVAALKPFISPRQREHMARKPDSRPIDLGDNWPDGYRLVVTLGDLRRLWAAFDALAGVEETALS